MYGELVAIAALVIVIAYQGWFIWAQRKQFEAIQRDLLNRVMSRNYETLVQAEVAKAEAERALTAEEIYERDQERGIPV